MIPKSFIGFYCEDRGHYFYNHQNTVFGVDREEAVISGSLSNPNSNLIGVSLIESDKWFNINNPVKR